MSKQVAALFGVSLEGGSREEVVQQVEQSSARPFWIVTANPEILLAAEKDSVYRAALQSADWRTIDGFGIQLVLRIHGYTTERLTGVDLGEALIKLASEKGWRIAFFGGYEQSAERAAEIWRARFPKLDLHVIPAGQVRDDGFEDGKTWEQRQVLQAIQPDIILVALGGGTKQERWIAEHRNEFSTSRVIVGVGGAFDMWSGTLRRAPKLVRALGLEWVWRLILQPTRWKRIWNAVVVFLFKAVRGA